MIQFNLLDDKEQQAFLDHWNENFLGKDLDVLLDISLDSPVVVVEQGRCRCGKIAMMVFMAYTICEMIRD